MLHKSAQQYDTAHVKDQVCRKSKSITVRTHFTLNVHRGDAHYKMDGFSSENNFPKF